MRLTDDEEQVAKEDAFTQGVVLGWKLAIVHYAGDSYEEADSKESLDALLEAIDAEDL